MDGLSTALLSAAAISLLLTSYTEAARDIQGEVVSIMLTRDCPTKGACALDVALRRSNGKLAAFHVPPDAKIVRRHKLIPLSQLNLGDMISIPIYDEITMGGPNPAAFD